MSRIVGTGQVGKGGKERLGTITMSRCWSGGGGSGSGGRKTLLHWLTPKMSLSVWWLN